MNKYLLLLIGLLSLLFANPAISTSTQDELNTLHKESVLSLSAQSAKTLEEENFKNEEFGPIGRELVEEIQKENTVEIYALLSSSTWGDDGDLIIYVGKKNVKLINRDFLGKYSYRMLSKEEFREIRDYVKIKNVDNLPPLRNKIYDGIQYEFIHVKKGFGRRVFMNNPQEVDRVYIGLVRLFRKLLKSKLFKEGHRAIDVNAKAKLLSKNDILPEWAAHLKRFPMEKELCTDELPNWQSRYREQFYYGSYDGIYSCDSENPEKRKIFLKGVYGNPVVSTDEKIMVIAKTETNWGNPNYIVRVDPETKKETRVGLETADNFHPVAYLDVRKQFLLEQYEDSLSRDMETLFDLFKGRKYFFLDPESGRVEKAKGEFFPWSQHFSMPLQKSLAKNKVWVARQRIEPIETEVGLYDIVNFKYQKIQTIKSIYFHSSNMWVDEARGAIFVKPDHLETNGPSIFKFQLN